MFIHIVIMIVHSKLLFFSVNFHYYLLPFGEWYYAENTNLQRKTQVWDKVLLPKCYFLLRNNT